MGDLRDWSPESNGVLEERAPRRSPSSSLSSSSSSSLLSSNQTAIGAEQWQRAEEATQGIIAQVQPTVVSEERRKAVIDYVQRLIRNCLGCEVFPFGSVPLKTYLPDGDIDLTAFGGLNVEEALANDVCSVLEREDQNVLAEFVVKDVQIIRAEVKLVKCLVQNIVVDISFNQLGGLCTLCFLEKVDRLIGKDHLFKRSIILIKAWCYYESRILGAHHGLISTYALETLVLYIFHLFHSSLNGPLAVLYKFLDYFSKFDWDNYCISLNGPVRISSLPEVVVETPENCGGDLLLSNDFLKDCVERFAVPARGLETNSRTFPPKHLNIVDPLKENNNLGRSVSKGNFYRIRSAFTYGARKLGRILSQPEENVVDDLCKFFSNTLDRHGSGQRPDVQDPVPISPQNGFVAAASSLTSTESWQDGLTICEPESDDSSGLTGKGRLDNEKLQHGGVISTKASGMDMDFCGTLNESQSSANGTAVSANRLSGDAEDLATSKIQRLAVSNDAAKSSILSEESIPSLGKAHHAPHLYFSSLVMGNGKMKDGNPERKQIDISSFVDKRVSFGILQAPSDEACSDLDENEVADNHLVAPPVGLKKHAPYSSSVAWSSEDLYPSCRRVFSTANGLETLHALSDLSGDSDSHLNSLQSGRRWLDYALNTSIPPFSPPMFPQFQSMNSWDLIQRSVPFRRSAFPKTNANGVVPRPVFYPMNQPIVSGAAFGVEEMPKARGTGTYFPNTNHYRDTPLVARGRNQVSARSPRSNGRAVTLPEATFPERGNRELAHAQFHVHQGGANSGSSDSRRCSSPEKNAQPNSNSIVHLSEAILEFGSIGHLPLGIPSVESGSQQSPSSTAAQNPSIPLSSPGRPKPVPGMDKDRVSVKSYQLKDEDDFPPLTN